MKFIHYSCTANVITEISAHSDRQSQHSLKIEGSVRLFECFIIVYHLTVFLPFGQSQHSLKIEGKSWSGFLLPTNSNFVMSLLEMHTKSRARSLFVHIKASGLEKF